VWFQRQNCDKTAAVESWKVDWRTAIRLYLIIIVTAALIVVILIVYVVAAVVLPP